MLPINNETEPLLLSCSAREDVVDTIPGGVSDFRSAVLVVGSTGSGKSSTIGKCTGQPVKTGDSDKSVTKTCQVYEIESR